MKTTKTEIIVICGPTSSGKSGVAIKLAKKFDGEIISADSRQIYRGMDIGTGKVIRDLQGKNPGLEIGNSQYHKEPYVSEEITHHLLDVADPMEEFNVSHFKKMATEAIKDILKREKLPIVCGGTGFWIQALVDDVEFPDVAPDEELRNELRNSSAEELFEQLKKIDSDRAATIDKHNPVRLIRAIEIAKKLGKVPKMKNQESGIRNYDFLQIGIGIQREMLNEKIKTRLDQRFDRGMIEEVAGLHDKGVSWAWLEKIGLEYRWIARYLQGKVPLEEMREKLYFDSIHYAKRQMTWLKRDKRIVWLPDYGVIEQTVENFIGN